MKRQAFQPGEIRDNNDNIIRPGAYGKKTALATSDNMGILDYIINNFDALYDAMNGGRVYVKSAADLPKTGDVAAVYIAEDTGKWYYWDTNASKYITIDNARTIANEGITARDAAKAWAESGSSPDGATDSDSSTGKTQSSKSWALYSKDRATAAASSASASASSASAAKTSQSDAASSASAAKTSETNAKSSQTAAASSASASASSASAAKSSQTAAATSETNAKTALVSCQNIQTQVNNGLQSLTSAVKYRGSVASFSALPASGQSVGDMYNIKAAGGTDANGTAIRAGDNVVWNGSGWDDQAGTVDLSNYYTKSEVNGAVVSATVSDATLTLIHKDASKSTVTVNNVAHATKASQDDKGQAIDVAAFRGYVDSNFLPLSGGALTGSLGINGVNQGITIQEKSMLATSSSSERFTDLLSHSDKNNNRFFFMRSGVKQDNDKYVELSMVDKNNNPAGGISLYYDNSNGAVSVSIYGKEIKTLFYPYYSIQGAFGGFTRFDGLQMFYTWIKAGATYTYPKPFSNIPRVFVQYLTGSNAPQFQNTSKTSFTNAGSNDCYLLAIGKGV